MARSGRGMEREMGTVKGRSRVAARITEKERDKRLPGSGAIGCNRATHFHA